MSADAMPVFAAHETDRIAGEFFREGCALVRGVFSPDDVAALRERTDAYALDPSSVPPAHISFVGDVFVLRRCRELDPLMAEMTTRPAVLVIAEAVLGPRPQFNAMNVIRNGPDQAISRWHLDDTLEFPLPPEIDRFDARIRMPVFWMTVQVALSDIESIEHGPTQFVPGSHYSGRYPPAGVEDPTFEGRGPTSVFCRAGDLYLTNHQCWHRGAPNVSDRTRYVMQLQYATRWADARFKGTA